ncbi:MAG: hypothetical protein WBX38_11740 [Candidatus Sulfotelmatobacter sp.]
MKTKSPPPKPHPEIETVRLLWLAIFVSVFSFLFYYRNGDVLLYGDAVAHINIARRVFDSKTPGLLQLGTVWLPLPHLLIMPFIMSKHMWQSGSGGSIPSMAAFIVGTLGIFRLARIVWIPSQEGLLSEANPNQSAILMPWLAALMYAANPNLIYIQSTAMGESLYLGLFIWTIVHFAEFAQGGAKAARSLTRCGFCLAAACLTRYDGWLLAAILVVAAVQLSRAAKSAVRRRDIAKFVLIAAAGPVLWLAYNAEVYRNPFEFANGPYSAQAITLKTATVNPAKGNLYAAGSYFLKAAELNVAASDWLGRLWLILALLGSAAAAFRPRNRVLLFLWSPLPFYALSVAYGSVPIFLPSWWPFSLYNARYGLQLLPAFAVFVPQGIFLIAQSVFKIPSLLSRRRWENAAALSSLVAVVGVSYGMIWRADPICYREASTNGRSRVALDAQMQQWIKSLPPDSTLLMYLGQHVEILEKLGVPLKRDINEGNHRVWKQPSDPGGLWERALADPAAYAEYVIGFEGDPVWKTAEDHHLKALVEIHTTGQPPAAIFQGRTPGH